MYHPIVKCKCPRSLANMYFINLHSPRNFFRTLQCRGKDSRNKKKQPQQCCTSAELITRTLDRRNDQFTPPDPTRQKCRVSSRGRRRCELNSRRRLYSRLSPTKNQKNSARSERLSNSQRRSRREATTPSRRVGLSRVALGRVKSRRVGSSRVELGRVALGRVKSRRVGSSRVGSGRVG